MKPAAFTYHCPHRLDEALALLGKHENARLLAGGQSLVPMLNLRLATPEHLIDLGRIGDLVGITQIGDRIVLGAMTTQRAIERSPLIAKLCPLLTEAIEHVGHQQTRNRGTIGGSLCHLDPAAELPVVAAALDATLVVTGKSGERRIPFAEFPAGYLTSQLHSDEILTRVEFPVLGPDAGSAFLEFSRRPADFAIVSIATALTLADNGNIRDAGIAIGGLGPAPVRLSAAEKVLRGRKPNAASADDAVATIDACPAEGDALYPASYRLELAAALTRRALGKAFARLRSATDG